MTFNDFAAYSKADSCSLERATTVQSLKNIKDPIQILFIEPNSIVFHQYLAYCDVLRLSGEAGVSDPFYSRMNFHYRRFAWLMEFQSVPDQVLKQLTYLSGVGVDYW